MKHKQAIEYKFCAWDLALQNKIYLIKFPN